MYVPIFQGTLGGGISQTLGQQIGQQNLIAQNLANANAFTDTVGRFDLLSQFAANRAQGQSPNQSLFNVSQQALNPAVSLNAFGQFGNLSAAQAPFAVGAALQGDNTLLNQLGAPIGIGPRQGALPIADILQASAAFTPGAAQALVQNQQNRQLEDRSAALVTQIANLTRLGAQNNQQQTFAQIQNEIDRLGGLRFDAGFGNLSGQRNATTQVPGFSLFPTASSSTGSNGFRSLSSFF